MKFPFLLYSVKFRFRGSPPPPLVKTRSRGEWSASPKGRHQTRGTVSERHVTGYLGEVSRQGNHRIIEIRRLFLWVRVSLIETTNRNQGPEFGSIHNLSCSELRGTCSNCPPSSCHEKRQNRVGLDRFSEVSIVTVRWFPGSVGPLSRPRLRPSSSGTGPRGRDFLWVPYLPPLPTFGHPVESYTPGAEVRSGTWEVNRRTHMTTVGTTRGRTDRGQGRGTGEWTGEYLGRVDGVH